MLGEVGVEELGFVHHVSGISDVGLQLLIEGEGEVEFIQRLPVRLLLLSQLLAGLLRPLLLQGSLGFQLF